MRFILEVKMRSIPTVIILVVLSLFVFTACGGDSEKKFKAVAVNGSIGGCHVEEGTNDLRVGIMAQDANENLIEMVSESIRKDQTSWIMLLFHEPPANANWIVEGDGHTMRTALQVFSYIDVDGTETYTPDDGDPTGVCSTKIFFFDNDYPDQSAVYGYNIMGSGGYSQDFVGTGFDVPAIGCD